MNEAPDYYRINQSTTGEFDLAVGAILLDDNGDDIDEVYSTDTVDEAVQWVEQRGGIVRRASCVRCGNVQLDIWARCETCASPVLVATDSLSEKAKFLAGIRTKIANSKANQTGNADRALDMQIEKFLVKSSIHSDHLDRFPESSRQVTANIGETVALLAETLPDWHVEMHMRAGGFSPKPDAAYVALVPPAKPGEFRHHSQEPEDMGGFSANGTTASLALLDAIFQVLLSQEVK